MATSIKPLMHPGFPRIGAIEVFRKNSAIELKHGEAALNKAIRHMPQYRQIKPSGKSALRGRTPHEDRDSPFILNVLIDKNAWRAGIEHIEAQLEEKMREFMFIAMLKARDTSRLEVSTMTRAFKSQWQNAQTKPATGDLYEVIGGSLDFEEVAAAGTGRVGRNQFVSFIGASREDGTVGTLHNTGVRGGGMVDDDKSLIELTEDGFDAFQMNLKIQTYYAAIRKNPAKRFRGG